MSFATVLSQAKSVLSLMAMSIGSLGEGRGCVMWARAPVRLVRGGRCDTDRLRPNPVGGWRRCSRSNPNWFGGVGGLEEERMIVSARVIRSRCPLEARKLLTFGWV